ncbi:MAG: hypothetical protein A2W93_08270 [Bacteroidetes bacterium GWF2_43_63]|nr:MAG: hypothetical protein A2W94_04925 [Bacteroidetes bacterium GWE2_42_42]OFY55604.1 MAG: hypothetical protein A2W93_08270 [Bacteroidetes bacterium GWF2_43_63]HBG71623.1 hypothetical protein [Bacteroidales bacterium]HCB62156.1 hypothetical protein [Bacteroidales bacterium]HCY22384.1 hypothetical protein [Bacteroidales bacterium]
MELALDLAKIVLPALMVFLTAFFVLKSYLENEQKKKELDSRFEQKRFSLPIRLQAYERLAMFLERINPESIVLRMNQPGMSAKELQAMLLQTIRMEYEHNLSQQVYVSNQAWDMVKNAKEDIIRIINTAGTTMQPNATAIDISTTIFEESLREKEGILQKALIYLKNEGRQYLDA